jgi:hypothetical protein
MSHYMQDSEDNDRIRDAALAPARTVLEAIERATGLTDRRHLRDVELLVQRRTHKPLNAAELAVLARNVARELGHVVPVSQGTVK